MRMKIPNAEGLSASLEDYIVAIFHLEQPGCVARAKDIADYLNVRRPSVTGALKSLAKRGLINYRPYGFISLTPTGVEAARDIYSRHEILEEFFMDTLHLSLEEAEAHACRIEHVIDPMAIEGLVHFLEFMKICPRTGLDWRNAFERYCRMGARTSDCQNCLRLCIKRFSRSQCCPDLERS
jgi:DtxR family Mn-dependent transcriptional regulator